jgi:hypothetical protein
MTISNLGSVLAVIALVVSLVLAIIGHLPWVVAGLIALLAVSRLT